MIKRTSFFRYLLTCFIFLFLFLPLAADAYPAMDEEGLLIAVVGDTRPGRDLKITETFLEIIDILNDIQPDAVFHVGDIIYGRTSNQERLEKEYKNFSDTVSGLLPPLFIAPGNHDIWDNYSSDRFEKTFGYLYRSIRLGNSIFILLNSEIPGQTCQITGKQREWLENELHKASERHDRIFVLIHRPMYPVKKHIGASLDRFPAERDALHELFKRFHVYAVISGHEHLYRTEKKDGIRYIISGGGGKELYGSEEEGGFHHFLLFKIHEEEIHASVVRVDEKKKNKLSFIKNWLK